MKNLGKKAKKKKNEKKRNKTKKTLKKKPKEHKKVMRLKKHHCLRYIKLRECFKGALIPQLLNIGQIGL
jgi:hypothetical protein